METAPPLSARRLSIGYRHKDATTALAEGLDLDLRSGEFVCLLGPNGAGKSTLIRTLAGLQPPLAGTLRLHGEEFGRFSPRQRARRLSVVLTDHPPTGMMDAQSLVALGRHPYSGWLGQLDEDDRRRIDQAIRAVGAEPLRHRPVEELSDGERQKISIARALAQEAKVMLLDEPTAFLDLPRRVELMALLRNLAHREGIGLLLSTHDLELALRFADRLWMLTAGGEWIQGPPESLVLDGSFDQVFASENLDWDPVLGSFRAHPEPCLHVNLKGEGLEYIWTRRALERLGFGLTDQPEKAALQIEILPGPIWRITRDGSTESVDRIAALIDRVR